MEGLLLGLPKGALDDASEGLGEDGDEMSMSKEDHAKRLMKAMKGGDPSKFAKAFEAMVEACSPMGDMGEDDDEEGY